MQNNVMCVECGDDISATASNDCCNSIEWYCLFLRWRRRRAGKFNTQSLRREQHHSGCNRRLKKRTARWPPSLNFMGFLPLTNTGGGMHSDRRDEVFVCLLFKIFWTPPLFLLLFCTIHYIALITTTCLVVTMGLTMHHGFHIYILLIATLWSIVLFA